MHDAYFLKLSMLWQSHGTALGVDPGFQPRQGWRSGGPSRRGTNQEQTATHPAHRLSGGRRRWEFGRPPWLSSACCTSSCHARGGAPRRWWGGARPAAMAEHSPSSRSRRGNGSHASPCLAERRHEKATGARPAAMSERSRSSRSRRHLLCVPVFGQAEAVDGSRSSAGRHGRELLDTPASLPRAAERRLHRLPEPCGRRRGGWISPGSSGSQRHTSPFPGRTDPRQRPIEEGGDKVKVTARG
jgi:hypothetical protein